MFQRKAQESHGFKAARNLPHHSTSPILPEDGSSSRKRWIVSFSQGNATLRCFTEQNTWQRASILLHTHPGFRVSLIHQSNCSNCKHKQIIKFTISQELHSFPPFSPLREPGNSFKNSVTMIRPPYPSKTRIQVDDLFQDHKALSGKTQSWKPPTFCHDFAWNVSLSLSRSWCLLCC